MTVFVTRPVSLGLLVLAVGVLFLAVQPRVRKSREEYLKEEEA